MDGTHNLFPKMTTWQDQSREFHFTMDKNQKGKVELPHLGFICLSVHTLNNTQSHLWPLTHLSPHWVSHRVTNLGFRKPPPTAWSHLLALQNGFWAPHLQVRSLGKKYIIKSVWLARKCGKVLETSVLGLGFFFISFLLFNPTWKMVYGFNVLRRVSMKMHHQICLVAEKMQGKL